MLGIEASTHVSSFLAFYVQCSSLAFPSKLYPLDDHALRGRRNLHCSSGCAAEEVTLTKCRPKGSLWRVTAGAMGQAKLMNQNEVGMGPSCSFGALQAVYTGQFTRGWVWTL